MSLLSQINKGTAQAVPEPKKEPETMSKQTQVIEMERGKDCKGSVRFETQDDKAAVSNVYVSRSMEGINGAKKVRVTIEVVNE